MTSRERVLRAVNHQEVDRQPVDFGGTVVTCMDKAAHERLLRHLGMDGDTGPHHRLFHGHHRAWRGAAAACGQRRAQAGHERDSAGHRGRSSTGTASA